MLMKDLSRKIVLASSSIVRTAFLSFKSSSRYEGGPESKIVQPNAGLQPSSVIKKLSGPVLPVLKVNPAALAI
jgi:hypothetical protein